MNLSGRSQADAAQLHLQRSDCRIQLLVYSGQGEICRIPHHVPGALLREHGAVSAEAAAATQAAVLAPGAGIHRSNPGGEAKRVMEITGSDPLPYGIESNRRMVETIVQFAVEQRIIPARVTVESLFAEIRGAAAAR